MRRACIAVLFSVVTIALVACSSSSGTSNPAGGTDTPDAAADAATSASDGGIASDGATASAGGSIADATRYSDATCDYQERCEPGLITALYGDVATCKARMGIIARSQGRQPGNGYTKAAVDACVASLTAASCAAPMPTCTFVGSLSDGTGCTENNQCASSYCDHAVGAPDGGPNCRGACHALAAENADCNYTDCAPDLYCDRAATPTCKKRGGVGASCGSSDECLATLDCTNKQCTAPVPPIATHGACTIGGPSCNTLAGEYCLVSDASLSGTCEPAAFANPGEACGQSGTSVTLCREGVCRFPNHDTKMPGVCVGELDDGAPCDPMTSYADGPNCQPAATCDSVTKVCVVVDVPICPG